MGQELGWEVGAPKARVSAYPSFVTLSKQAPNRQAMPSGHGRRGLAPTGHSL
jgi:hypothetical protein